MIGTKKERETLQSMKSSVCQGAFKKPDDFCPMKLKELGEEMAEPLAITLAMDYI